MRCTVSKERSEELAKDLKAQHSASLCCGKYSFRTNTSALRAIAALAASDRKVVLPTRLLRFHVAMIIVLTPLIDHEVEPAMVCVLLTFMFSIS